VNGQNKKLNPERKIRPGLAWWIYIAKKILAVNAGGKVMKKNLRCATCSPQVWEVLTKKIPALGASAKP